MFAQSLLCVIKSIAMASLYDCAINGLPQLWTVDKAVGSRCANSIVDVYLIQFFLKKVVAGPKYPKIYVPPALWDVNGSWQDSMHAGIRLFQYFLYKRRPDDQSLPQLVNGRVDPIHATAGLKYQSSLNSTMVYLNYCFRLQNKELFDNLLTKREVPPYLHFAMLKAGVAHQKRTHAP